MKIDIPVELSDDDLEARLKALARGEQEGTALLVAHLAEFDARRLYLGPGFSSLFNYCCEVLHLSEPATYNRIQVARAARAFPAILPMLAEGRLSLATVRLLAPRLTSENQQELLAQASGKSKRAVEEMLARYFPRPDVPSSVRKLPDPAIAGLNGRADGCLRDQHVRAADAADSGTAPRRQTPCPRTLRVPVHGERRGKSEPARGPGSAPSRDSQR